MELPENKKYVFLNFQHSYKYVAFYSVFKLSTLYIALVHYISEFVLCLVMDKSHEARSNGKGICEKIRRSLAASTGYVQQDVYVMPALGASKLQPSKNMLESKHGFKAGVVPIEFDRSVFINGKQGNGHVVVEGKAKYEAKQSRQYGNEDQINMETESKMNDKFSEYIHHAKIKIGRTSSNVGARGIARLDTVNKKASAYIERARKRINNSATFRPS